jgi:hypothetical protein
MVILKMHKINVKPKFAIKVHQLIYVNYLFARIINIPILIIYVIVKLIMHMIVVQNNAVLIILMIIVKIKQNPVLKNAKKMDLILINRIINV